MAKFLLVEHQGGGCDYTIECGTQVTEFDAPSMEAAVALLRKNALDDAARDDDLPGCRLLDSHECEREWARVYQVSEPVGLPLDEWAPEPEAPASFVVGDRVTSNALPGVWVVQAIASDGVLRVQREGDGFIAGLRSQDAQRYTPPSTDDEERALYERLRAKYEKPIGIVESVATGVPMRVAFTGFWGPSR